MAKLKDNDIKKKIRAKFNEYEIYNPEFNIEIYNNLIERIKENSKQTELENNEADIQIDTINIMREMLIGLSNIEDEDYWRNISDCDLDTMLNLADGDFKLVIQMLMDIMLELAQDIRIQEIRKLNILKNKLNEFVEVFNFNSDIDNLLDKFGLDRELFIKIQNGDTDAVKKFQEIITNKINKPKRKYTKKINK
ncbi:hypothetical protein [Clostridium beijerinckii]|uniref:hypothetical protein n=1 Tax=Clostridium beijerinckii TaxID=1520 RepID=UPI00156DBA6F|nr:hypothetical protein [Clostridium beijerinckii]NRU52577.1 hypothetical protein [Clostridium beijerinckii]NYC69246.1 hypothetical protein [Clostridium beijerinckii]NYC91778.1 hypothetical protein [Clostridium beijerinckii]